MNSISERISGKTEKGGKTVNLKQQLVFTDLTAFQNALGPLEKETIIKQQSDVASDSNKL